MSVTHITEASRQLKPASTRQRNGLHREDPALALSHYNKAIHDATPLLPLLLLAVPTRNPKDPLQLVLLYDPLVTPRRRAPGRLRIHQRRRRTVGLRRGRIEVLGPLDRLEPHDAANGALEAAHAGLARVPRGNVQQGRLSDGDVRGIEAVGLELFRKEEAACNVHFLVISIT